MEEIEDIIIDILNKYNHHWPSDITDQVFLAIEQDSKKLKRYHEFADGDYATTNSMIGRYVKEYTGMKSIRETDLHKSKLIKSFMLLG
jgi:hypothetical protein